MKLTNPNLSFRQEIQVVRKFLPSLMLFTLVVIVIIMIGSLISSKWMTSPVSSMKGLTASMDSQFFMDLIQMEVPPIEKQDGTSTFSQANMSHFIFQFLTDINPTDPRSLIAGEIPGMGADRTVLMFQGTGTDPSVYPTDYIPAPGVLGEEPPENRDHPVESDPSNGANREDDPSEASQEGLEHPGDTGSADGNGEQSDDDPIAKPTTNGKKKVFIYHTHNTESWVPELKHRNITDLDEAYDGKTNITLLGKRLAKRLEELGIGAVSSDVDYRSTVKDFNWNFSYKYSLKTVQEAFAVNPELEYFFDIHRDSQKRDLTTVTIDQKDYAQLYFIIGQKNPHWEQNVELARKIHQRIDELYPGISRGVWSKSNGHAEYNQSVSPNSILIEVGGPENTLEESQRTIDVLSSVIAEIFWEAEKVDAPAEGQQHGVPIVQN